MRVGPYTLTEFLSSHPLFTRHSARHVESDVRVEIRLLSPACLTKRGALENQLRRLAWVRSSHVRQPLSFDLECETPHIVFSQAESDAAQLNSANIESFVSQASAALQSIHEVGLCAGPIDWPLFSWDGNGNCQMDATGLLTHLSVDAELSFAHFEFAAPESIDQGCCDPISDICSWGLFLRKLLAEQPGLSTSSFMRLRDMADRLAATDPVERAALSELAPSAAARLDATAATSAIESMTQSSSSSAAPYEGTLAAEIAASTNSHLTLQSQLGRFVIEEKLGEGGMGAVYRARDLAGSQFVALKVLSDSLSRNPRAVKRFAKEARLLALARSPYVANLVEANTESDPCYLVSEFVEGGSLGDWMQADELLPFEVALALLADASRGLALAHDRGIVHRDIKPDNILLTRSGRDCLDQWRANKTRALRSAVPGEVLAKLADFGIARTEYQTESLAMTAENSLLGTPLYMAPEQCMGSQVDPRADVYSLGITLYRLLAGRTPFQADSNLQLMSMHANEAPPALRQFAPDVPEAATRVIEKCLAKNPDARYSHARELLVDLENLLRGEPTAIGLHPPLINQGDGNSLTFEHVWDLQSSAAQLWPYVAHTDRVNHAMGLTAVDYITHNDPVMGVTRMAETTVAGQRLRWREHPYEWIEGKRLSVLREFTQGPFEWFVNVVELLDRVGGGTTVRQTLKVKPRNWLGKTLAKLQLGNKSRKSFGRVYADIDRFIQSDASVANPGNVAKDPWGDRFQMTAAQRSRLQSRMRALGNQPSTLVLGDLIEHGSELEVARIRPFALADRCQLDRTDVMETCLQAAREGVLVLLWDILCPSCRIPSDVVDTLASLKDHAHCQACNIEFELDFSRSIEMIFRAHPELRSAETRTYCIGGPAWSRHVVAQVRLARDERFVCDVELEPGAYAIRGPQLPFSVPFQVSPVGTESRWEVSMSRAPQLTAPIVLRAGRQAIWLWNDAGRDLEVRVERMASRHDAVTAASAASSALFRELFGDQVLAGGQLISVAHITYLLIKMFGTGELYRELGDAPAFSKIRAHLSIIEASVKQHGGAVIKSIGETVVATFPTQLSAFKCAEQLCARSAEANLQTGAVVHSGPAVVATLDDRLDYFGRLVHEALACLESCRPGGIIATTDSIAVSDIQQWAEQSGHRVASVEHNDLLLVNVFVAQ